MGGTFVEEKKTKVRFTLLSSLQQIKVEPAVPAPSPVIPRLTLRVGAGQDKM